MLRLATETDLPELLRWRNDPVTRHFRNDDRIIDPDEHRAWLDRRQKSASCVYIYEHDGMPVGNITLDVDENGYEMGWIVAPEWRDKGIGKAMVTEALTLVPDGAPVWCKARADNVASCELARAVGFIWSDQDKMMRYFEYRRPAAA